MVTVNTLLQETNRNTLQTESLAHMWGNYMRNVEYNLEATGNHHDKPLLRPTRAEEEDEEEEEEE